jgi:hypothetical protein
VRHAPARRRDHVNEVVAPAATEAPTVGKDLQKAATVDVSGAGGVLAPEEPVTSPPTPTPSASPAPTVEAPTADPTPAAPDAAPAGAVSTPAAPADPGGTAPPAG